MLTSCVPVNTRRTHRPRSSTASAHPIPRKRSQDDGRDEHACWRGGPETSRSTASHRTSDTCAGGPMCPPVLMHSSHTWRRGCLISASASICVQPDLMRNSGDRAAESVARRIRCTRALIEASMTGDSAEPGAGMRRVTCSYRAHVCNRCGSGGVFIASIARARCQRKCMQVSSNGSSCGRLPGRAHQARVEGHDRLYACTPERVAAGRMNFSPATITFVAFPEAGNRRCR